MTAPAFLVPSRAPAPAIAISRLAIAIDMTAGNVSAHAGGKPAGRMIR